VRPLPTVTQLAPATPNPFRQTATIAFSLAQGGPVELAVFSVDGRRVRTLVGESREPGEYRVTWDGRDDRGNPMSAGVYYAQLKTARRGFTRTLTYLK
jgi:flagellar hook assembly protein FlgD